MFAQARAAPPADAGVARINSLNPGGTPVIIDVRAATVSLEILEIDDLSGRRLHFPERVGRRAEIPASRIRR
jgi:hypothetical protein